MEKTREWKQYLMVVAGSALFAASVNLLIVPLSLYSAGIVGIAPDPAYAAGAAHAVCGRVRCGGHHQSAAQHPAFPAGVSFDLKGLFLEDRHQHHRAGRR